jgi:hypothetical protein
MRDLWNTEQNFQTLYTGVSLRRQPPFVPQEDSWYSFLLEAESTPEP